MLLCKHKKGRILHGEVKDGKALVKFKCSACGRTLKKEVPASTIYQANPKVPAYDFDARSK